MTRDQYTEYTKNSYKLGIVYSSTWEAGAEGLQVQDQTGLHIQILSQMQRQKQGDKK